MSGNFTYMYNVFGITCTIILASIYLSCLSCLVIDHACMSLVRRMIEQQTMMLLHNSFLLNNCINCVNNGTVNRLCELDEKHENKRRKG